MRLLTFLIDVNGDDILDQLIPRPEELIVQLIATFIVVLIVAKLGWKPIRNFIKKRQDYVEDHIKKAETSAIEAENSLKEAKDLQLKASLEYKNQIEKAKIDALVVRDEIIKQAQTQIDLQKSKSEKQIKSDLETANSQLETEIIEIAIKAAEKILKREVNTADNRKIVEDFVKGELK